MCTCIVDPFLMPIIKLQSAWSSIHIIDSIEEEGSISLLRFWNKTSSSDTKFIFCDLACIIKLIYMKKNISVFFLI
jgi:hypothetical protein